jgi:retron-type reverse transcriptase
LQSLLARIRRNTYKPQASRLVEIPKEDRSTIPVAIACFEDKIVQQAASKILTAIFEPLFLLSSYGYREGINGHEALRVLMKFKDDAEKIYKVLPKRLEKYRLKLHEDKSSIIRSGSKAAEEAGGDVCPHTSF